MIIYFSGNGNSKSIAVTLSQQLSTPAISLEHRLLTNPGHDIIRPTDDKPIVWVFPVYSWGIPPVLVRFMKECNIENAHKVTHHLVVSCGDDTGTIATQWRRLLKKRGWKTASATSVIMPNTYVLMKGFDTDSPKIARRKLDLAKSRILTACHRINENKTDDLMETGKFAWIKSHIIYPWFIRYAMSARPFHVTDNCLSCGLCASQCPMDNITMNPDNKPQWHDNCAQCLRCYHRCPAHAIAYGKATEGKHQYPGPNKQ